MTELRELKVVTPLPGPKSQELMELRKKNVPEGVSYGAPIFIKRGQGALFEDVDGNVLMDFAGGIGVLNIGYSHPEVVEAVKEQAEKYFHTSINVVQYEQYVRLAEKLNQIIPGNFEKKTMFVNSGGEAVENAIKIARKYTKRTEIITFTGAFHGRTLMTMTLTSKERPYKYGFGPFAAGVHRVEFPYVYRAPEGIAEEDIVNYYLQKIENLLYEGVAADTVAAIIMEPVQGEGGFTVPPKEYVQGIRKICDQHGILFIADEVQSGFCRTGKMFATNYWEEFGVYPDIVTSAKSIAAGVPLSAVTGKAEIMDAVHPGGIGGTYGGNPLATAAALKVIEVMERDDYTAKANHIADITMKRLNEMKAKYDIIGDVRGLGAMMAVELVTDQKTKAPAKEAVGQIIQECWKNGLIILSAGVYSNVIRFLMPLVITDAQLNMGLDILDRAFAKATK